MKNNTNQSRNVRTAFTLVELLVVIAIIGVLVGLLLPAVQSAREASRRAACGNKIRQIALGMHQHLDAMKAFPFGAATRFHRWYYTDGSEATVSNSSGKTVIKDRRGWMIMITPYVELPEVFDEVMAELNINGKFPNQTAVATSQYPSFMCPSDMNAGKSTASTFRGNYLAAASSASLGLGGGLDGLFYTKSSTKPSQVTDGLSKTVMLGENVVVPANDVRGAYFDNATGETLFSTKYQPNTSVHDKLRGGVNWEPMAPNDHNSNKNTSSEHSTRSWHPGGVNIAMADASTRFVSNDVSANVWTAAGSRNGSEALPGLD